MKTALKIIGIILATFVLLIVLIVSFSGNSDSPEITPTNKLSEADKAYSDSIALIASRAKDSIRIEEEKNKIAKKETAEKKLKAFRSKTDEFNGTTFYHHPQSPKYTNVNFVYPYFGEKDGTYWLRLTFQYTADSWLFIQRIKIKTDAGQYELAPDFKTDNNSDIWEWADIQVSPAEYSMLRDMASSKEVLIRYEGRQYQKDRKLTAKEKSVITETLDVFDALK